eukprot:767630-Hanusia_phi.AAC.1
MLAEHVPALQQRRRILVRGLGEGERAGREQADGSGEHRQQEEVSERSNGIGVNRSEASEQTQTLKEEERGRGGEEEEEERRRRRRACLLAGDGAHEDAVVLEVSVKLHLNGQRCAAAQLPQLLRHDRGELVELGERGDTSMHADDEGCVAGEAHGPATFLLEERRELEPELGLEEAPVGGGPSPVVEGQAAEEGQKLFPVPLVERGEVLARMRHRLLHASSLDQLQLPRMLPRKLASALELLPPDVLADAVDLHVGLHVLLLERDPGLPRKASRHFESPRPHQVIEDDIVELRIAVLYGPACSLEIWRHRLVGALG